MTVPQAILDLFSAGITQRCLRPCPPPSFCSLPGELVDLEMLAQHLCCSAAAPERLEGLVSGQEQMPGRVTCAQHQLLVKHPGASRAQAHVAL